MHTMNSCYDERIKDHDVADDDSDTYLNNKEWCADEVASNKKSRTAWKLSENIIPKKPRTHRVFVRMIINEKNLKEPNKCSCDENYTVSDDDFGEQSYRKKRPKKVEKRAVTSRKKPSPQEQYSPPKFTQNLQDHISRLNLEAPPLFVAQKTLYVTDIRRGQSRLSLPKNLINPDFFDKFVTDNEKMMLKEKEHIEVSLVDNKLHEYNNTLNLVKWNLSSSSIYVLTTGWNEVVKDNKLEEAVLEREDNKLKEVVLPKFAKEETIVVMEEDDKLKSDVVVQVWCFRKESRLWFALNMQGMTERSVIGKTENGRNIVTRLLSD